MVSDGLHRRNQLTNAEFLVEDTEYLELVLAEDGYLFQVIRYGN